MDAWRAELDELIARGRDSHGEVGVREALEELLAGLVEAPAVVRLTPPVSVLGLSACEGGWVGVLVRSSGQTTLHVGSSLVALLEQIRDQEALGVVGVVAGSHDDEVETWQQTRPTVEVVRISDPDTDPGALARAGLTLPAMYAGMGFELEELRIAGAAAITASHLFS